MKVFMLMLCQYLREISRANGHVACGC